MISLCAIASVVLLLGCNVYGIPQLRSLRITKPSVVCPPSNPFAFVRDLDSCQAFHRCSWGRPVRSYTCGRGLVFNTRYLVCVWEGSGLDDCKTKTTTKETLDHTLHPRCLEGETVFAHPKNCAMFYNCSLVYAKKPRFGEQNLDECKYPDLFDTETLKCMDFESVKCGSRKEPKFACDYKRNHCVRAHCAPCEYRTPSCINVSDGPYFDTTFPYSKSYVECKSERTVLSGMCDEVNGLERLFSPVLLRCIDPNVYPSNFDCSAKGDGFYPETEGRCNLYVECKDQKYISYSECPKFQHFDPVSQTCQYPSDICPPCGSGTSGC